MQPVVTSSLLLLTPCSRLLHPVCCYSHHAAGCYIHSAATHTMQPVVILDLLLLILCRYQNFRSPVIWATQLSYPRLCSYNSINISINIILYHFTLLDHPTFLFKNYSSFSFSSVRNIFLGT